MVELGSNDLEGKTNEASSIIHEALRSAKAPTAAFGGGKESVVLLHMLRKASGGNINMPVVVLDPPKEYRALYYFIAKMGRLWGLDMVRLGAPEAKVEGGLPEPVCEALYAGIAGLIEKTKTRLSFTHLFTGLRQDEEGVGDGIARFADCGGVALVNPLLNFTEMDVWEYISLHRLPYCTLYRHGFSKLGCLPGGARGKTAPVEKAGEAEEADIKKRLQALGYV